MSKASYILAGGGTASLQIDPEHPNQMKFKGVLVRLDEPSTKPPGGAEGHRILLPTGIAKERLGTLLNMGLNYSPSLDTHAQRRKVGTITRAWIDGQNLCIEGLVWKHDFPEAEQDLKQKGLGMSMEIGNVHVEDPEAPIWKITDFYFLGATILWKDAAAYYRTQAIAAKAQGAQTMSKAVAKPTPKKTPPAVVDITKIAEVAAAAATKAATDSLQPIIGRQTRLLGSVMSRLDDMETRLLLAGAEVDAKGKKEDEEEDEDACDMASKAKEDDDDDEDDDDEEDIDAEDINKGDLEELGPETGDDEEDDDDPGHLSQGAKNKGDKTTSDEKVGKTVSSARLKQALKSNKMLAAKVAQLSQELAAAKTKSAKAVAKVQKQVAAATQQMTRKSLDSVSLGLLSKSGINAQELQSSGQKLAVAEVDAILAAGSTAMGIVERMQFKNNLRNAGLMDDGVVERRVL